MAQIMSVEQVVRKVTHEHEFEEKSMVMVAVQDIVFTCCSV